MMEYTLIVALGPTRLLLGLYEELHTIRGSYFTKLGMRNGTVLLSCWFLLPFQLSAVYFPGLAIGNVRITPPPPDNI